MADSGQEPVEEERFERTLEALRSWLDRIRRIPVVLTVVLWSSVAAGLIIAWLWFLTSDFVWIRWLGLPWLAIIAVPQVGLWILASSVRELFELPERLRAIKSGVADGGVRALETLRREEQAHLRKRGFLRTLRDAYALHGEVGKVVATRAILHRFTGPIAVFIGPVSFVANCAVIVLAVATLILAAP
ncbi:MAG: hypothetical protein OEU54_12945 [Gemmatimonadota bacterium]|nr:hypothetical protein [Gemmatimonadota bacterium]